MDEHRLRSESVEIKSLLERLHDLVDTSTWELAETIVCRIVRLYGAGLAHSLAHAEVVGVDREALAESIASDDLLASLLVVHGIHPLSTEERIKRAISMIDPHASVEVDGSSCELRTITDAESERLIRLAIEIAAPEITSVEFAALS